MPVAPGNRRQQITFSEALWGSLEAERQQRGKTVSEVVSAHIEASRAGTMIEAQQILARLDTLEARFDALEALLVKTAAPPVAPPELALFGVPVAPAPVPTVSPPAADATVRRRRGWFRRTEAR